MIDCYAVNEKVYQSKTWKNQKVIVASKLSAGMVFLDVRKWAERDGDYKPSKGIMLNILDWVNVVPLIQEMIDENNVSSANLPSKTVDNNPQP